MLKTIRIRNFKSLTDVSVKLEPVTVLIGRSGTGKSNFVDALRWLRDFLTSRNTDTIQQQGGWHRVMSATAEKPMSISFALTFDAPGIAEDYEYLVAFHQGQPNQDPQFQEEKLSLGKRVLFHQEKRKWIHPPALVVPPQPGALQLGALTGIQEVTVAHLVLTSGIGCYAFPDNVLRQGSQKHLPGVSGLSDGGENFLQTVIAINVNLETWQSLRDIAASLRILKPSLRSMDLQLPERDQVKITHNWDEKLLLFDLAQESEGFRRLLACLLALYQTPRKQTVTFDEPEKGLYPAGLAILAEEFKAYARKGWGQVILTTHSPEFLDKFAPDQIRVVEMKDFRTTIGPIAPDQLESLREHFLQASDLLTVDEARLGDRAEVLIQ